MNRDQNRYDTASGGRKYLAPSLHTFPIMKMVRALSLRACGEYTQSGWPESRHQFWDILHSRRFAIQLRPCIDCPTVRGRLAVFLLWGFRDSNKLKPGKRGNIYPDLILGRCPLILTLQPCIECGENLASLADEPLQPTAQPPPPWQLRGTKSDRPHPSSCPCASGIHQKACPFFPLPRPNGRMPLYGSGEGESLTSAASCSFLTSLAAHPP